MGNTDINPFPISQYMGAATFCDREKETNTLVSGLANGQNFTLLSIRRIGKTGLIRHVLNKISSNNDVFGVYIDIQFTQNQADFALVLAKEIALNFPIHR